MSGAYPIAEDTPTHVLVQACIAGDQAAHALFVSRYGAFINRAVKLQFYRSTQAVIPGALEPDDIAQDIVARSLTPDYSMLKSIRNAHCINAWLSKVAYSATMDKRRKYATQKKTVDALARETSVMYAVPGVDKMVKDETINEIRNHLHGIPDKDGLFLKMHYIDGLSYAEIAMITDTNINNVASIIRRAKAKMRQIIQEDQHE